MYCQFIYFFLGIAKILQDFSKSNRNRSDQGDIPAYSNYTGLKHQGFEQNWFMY